MQQKRKKQHSRRKKRMMLAYVLRSIVAVVGILLIIGIIFAVKFIFSSVSGAVAGKPITQTTVEIKGNGSIVNTLIEDFDESVYSVDELRSTIDNEIAEYNAKTGNLSSVVLKSFEVKKSVAKAQIEMSSVEDYKNFNLVSFNIGTIPELMAYNVQFDVELLPVNDSDTAIMPGNISSISDRKAIIVYEKTVFRTPDKILYHSNNVEMISDRDAKLVGDGPGYIIY